jgi:hypothetical protein
MRSVDPSKRWFVVAATFVVVTGLGCSLGSKSLPTADVYVSVKGSDSSGDGSPAKPWRHIQYAIDNATQPAGTALTIHLVKGIYEENLVVHRPLQIIGAGVGVPSVNADDPLTPIQEISLIHRQNPGGGPGILIENATSVKLQDLVAFGGGVRAVNTRFIMVNVEVQQSTGLYGVQIEDCFIFYIEKSKIMTGTLRSDYGVDIIDSDGTILETYLGDLFDHVINISPIGAGEKIDPYKPFQAEYVSIRDSTIAGSNIFYADGIRIQGATNARISNTKITRTHPDNEPAASGTTHNPPYAAIDIGGYLTKANIEGRPATKVELDGVTTGGFDVGVGMSVESINVMVANSTLSALGKDVTTSYVGYTDTVFPRVDFGGGDLSGAGGNTFSTGNVYAFFHDAPYDVSACNNQWGVSPSQVDATRIRDKLDVAGVGRVNWDCG